MFISDKLEQSTNYKRPMSNLLIGLLTLIAVATISSCGGGAATTQQVPQANGGSTTGQIVKPSADGDMAKFRDTLWATINDPSSRCGQCHAAGKIAGSYPFADINDLAGSYNTANQDKYVNRTFPDQSGMVKKVAGGHNCWVSNPQTCATELTNQIKNWVQSSTQSGGAAPSATILTAPTDSSVAGGYLFPTTPPAGYTQVHTDLINYGCNGCHVPTAAQAQQPYFAVASITDSYNAVVSNSKINLAAPDQSRLYLRLIQDHHNCGANCVADANQLLTDIIAMVPQTTAITQEPGTIVSRAVNLYTNGIVASGGRRVEDNQIIVYDFKEGSGYTVHDGMDLSGNGYNLTINNGTDGTDFKWLQSWGVSITNGNVNLTGGAANSSAAGNKLLTLMSSGSYTVEAWVIPANTTQKEANIVGFMQNQQLQNFSLTQYEKKYQAFNRVDLPTGSTVNITDQQQGAPALEATKVLPSLQHVVVTYSHANGRRIYVDGVYTGDKDTVAGVDILNWDPSYGLKLGTVDPQYPWTGTIRKVAIHKRELTADEIQLNFAAGVGQKYLLMFNISNPSVNGTPVAGIPDSYIYLQVQEYDDFSYLFYKPTYINLRNASALPSDAVGLRIKGIRLGINGRESPLGQAFGSVDKTINSTDYIPGNIQDSGQVLSYVGTVIPKEKNATTDQFFLSFEILGTATATKNYNPQVTNLTPPPTNPLPVFSDVSIHTFEEINASLSLMTGIDRTTPSIGGTSGTYTTVYQQLPPAEAIDGFQASQQMAITQLAIQYCNELVNDTNKRAAYFPNVNFSGMNFSVDQNKDYVIDPLLVKVLNYDSVSTLDLLTDTVNSENPQPTSSAVRGILRTLIGDLSADATNCPSSNCNAARTAAITKATCAAAISGAPMLLQ